MNLGQSQFQDTFFVAGAQLTPYRQLRQLELELRSIESALKQSEFATRRLVLKLSKLDPNDAEQAIDIDEAKWATQEQEQMLQDAQARKANFLRMKAELLAGVPQEYWDAGFEANECNHWTAYLTKQLTMSQMLGMPDRTSLEMVMLMPQEAQNQIMLGVNKQVIMLQQRNADVLAIEAEIKHS